jgi:type IV pilus assembly protein PilE
MNFGYSAITIAELRAPTRQHGFSLLELLIAVVVVAILSSIAFPAYYGQLRKGSRAAAQALLVDVANRQAQYLLDARNYAVGPASLTTLNIALPAEVAGFYNIAVENGSGGTTPTTPPTFLIKATPIAGTRQEADGELRLAHDGGKWRGGSPGW